VLFLTFSFHFLIVFLNFFLFFLFFWKFSGNIGAKILKIDDFSRENSGILENRKRLFLTNSGFWKWKISFLEKILESGNESLGVLWIWKCSHYFWNTLRRTRVPTLFTMSIFHGFTTWIDMGLGRAAENFSWNREWPWWKCRELTLVSWMDMSWIVNEPYRKYINFILKI